MPHDNDAHARRIIDDNLYMTLATADAEGRPWATPVYFGVIDYRDFLWVSKPGARHSRNIAQRPQVAIVIFDSRVPIGTGRGVYIAAEAHEVAAEDVDAALAAYSARERAHGGRHFARADVLPPARHRLYRAVAAEHFVLDERDERIPVAPQS